MGLFTEIWRGRWRRTVTHLIGGRKVINSVLGMLNQRHLVRYASRSVQRVGYKNMKPNREIRARHIDLSVIREKLVIGVIGVDENCPGRKY